MKNGFIRVACASPELRVADCAFNAGKMVEALKDAMTKRVRLLVFPELSLTGYTCGDLFSQQVLLDGAQKGLRTLLRASVGYEMVIVVGMPISAFNKLYNCAVVIQSGKLLGVIPKAHLPNYGEFYEQRNFAPAFPGVNSITLCGQTVPFGQKLLFCCDELSEWTFAVEICEDLWVPQPPSVSHALAGATVIVNLSASDEIVGKATYRRQMLQSTSARLLCGYLYADAGNGESTTDMVFAGNSMIAENGTLLAEAPLFSNEMIYTELDVQRLVGERRRISTYPAANDEGFQRIPFSVTITETSLTRYVAPLPFVPSSSAERAERCEDILAIQAHGLRKRLLHSGAKTAVLGLSGGLDSTLALLVCARAMKLLNRPVTDIVAVTMPCFGTTARTKGNAELLAEKVGVQLRTIDIAKAVEVHFEDLGHDPKALDVVFENSQARERTQLLMDIANQTDGIVIGTGDLSELALGWATYNGDHMSMYGVNASIPKTLIRHLVRYEADLAADDALRHVLLDVLDTPVSPELLPAENGEISQKTEGIVGPYELHDFFLYYSVRWSFTPQKVLRLAEVAFAGTYNRATLLKWMRTFYRRFFSQQFKRSCLPDGPKVGSLTLSPRGDWRMPSDASSALWLEEIDNLC
ncbi:MAG: synthetase [Oscillospiraceae bacterium]|jgi:NAD+ synthase (glutamine-hydrolysing)|nr:synthetase [Oscillospiraceae bacterium]